MRYLEGSWLQGTTKSEPGNFGIIFFKHCPRARILCAIYMKIADNTFPRKQGYSPKDPRTEAGRFDNPVLKAYLHRKVKDGPIQEMLIDFHEDVTEMTLKERTKRMADGNVPRSYHAKFDINYCPMCGRKLA